MNLKLYTYKNNSVVAFPNNILQAELYDYTYECKRMGNAPTISATIMYPTCLDSLWNEYVGVEFKGERYFIENKPSSSYSNQDTRYKHEITFVSERKALENVYFKDSLSPTNKDAKTLTDFSFFGDLSFFASKLNESLATDSIDYIVKIDNNITTEEKDIRIENMYILDALQYAVEQFAIPYYFIGKEIHFGDCQTEIRTPFKYGVTNALLSVNRDNTNNKKVNKITGVGSSENIPYYYPNFNESGEHDVTTDPTGYADDISKLNYLKIDPYTSLRNGGYAQYYKACVNPIGNDFDEVTLQINKNSFLKEYKNEWKEELWNSTVGGEPHIEKDIEVVVFVKSNRDNIITVGKKISIKNDYGNTILDPNDIQVIASTSSSVGGFWEIITEDVSYTDNNDDISFNYNASFSSITNIKVVFKFKYYQTTSSSGNYSVSTNFSYDTKYSTLSSNTTVKSTDGTIDEKVYLDFNKIIDYPNGIRTYRETFTYKVTREVAGYSTANLNSVFKGVFLDNNGGDMSEWNHFIPNSIVVKNSKGNTVSHYLSQGNYIHFRNTSDARDIFTIEMSAVVQMSTESTDIKAYGVELEYIPDFNRKENPYDYWKFHDGKEVKYSVAGIKFNDTSAIPDGLKVIFSATKNWIEPKQNLMPYKYRHTLGQSIFYLAENGLYKDSNNNDIVFENPYDANRVKELVADTKEDIKPTIVGVTNGQGQRIDMFADVAFDNDDNNDWMLTEDGESQELQHSFFFVKLRKTDGQYGFNLFDQALESGEMTISMTSGQCGACNFTIMVDEETMQNTVQVDANGNLVRDDDGNVKFGSPQDKQQDTSKNEVWIALRKSEDDYGIVLPNKESNLVPTTDDNFVITNILLPQTYIEKAERKLESELIKEMLDNNTDKYNYGIDFSRIYLAENNSVYNQLNENAKVYIEYNGIRYNLYISSYSYKVENNKSLPEIKVDLVDKLTITRNVLEITERNVIKKVESIVIDNTSQTRGGKNNKGTIKLAQTTGDSTTKAMSQKAVTDALKNVQSGNGVDVVQTTGSSTVKVMSQKAVTDEINELKELLLDNDIEVVQEKGTSTTKIMSQKATSDAIDNADNVLPFDGFIDDAEISLQTNPYDGGKIYFVKSKNKFAYYRESDNLYTAMWNGYNRYSTFISGKGVIPNINTLFINDSKVYIFNGDTLISVGNDNITPSIEMETLNTVSLSANTSSILKRYITLAETTILDINVTFSVAKGLSKPANIDVYLSCDGEIVSRTYCVIPDALDSTGNTPNVSCYLKGVIKGSNKNWTLQAYTTTNGVSVKTDDNSSYIYTTEY